MDWQGVGDRKNRQIQKVDFFFLKSKKIDTLLPKSEKGKDRQTGRKEGRKEGRKKERKKKRKNERKKERKKERKRE